jgi:hypothetical protein
METTTSFDAASDVVDALRHAAAPAKLAVLIGDPLKKAHT